MNKDAYVLNKEQTPVKALWRIDLGIMVQQNETSPITICRRLRKGSAFVTACDHNAPAVPFGLFYQHGPSFLRLQRLTFLFKA